MPNDCLHMEKVFTIHFSFQSLRYAALVKLRQVGQNLRCFVRYLDCGLHNIILPGKCLVFSLGEGLIWPKKVFDETAAKLVSVTAEAISNQFQAEQNY